VVMCGNQRCQIKKIFNMTEEESTIEFSKSILNTLSIGVTLIATKDVNKLKEAQKIFALPRREGLTFMEMVKLIKEEFKNADI